MTELDDRMIGQLLLGRYRVVQLLAQGGMGAVYLARVEGAAGFAKPVVVKRILPHLSDSREDQERFIREAKILSSIHHPGILDVIDFGKAGGAYLMVLEYVHGYHLGQWSKYVIRSRNLMPWAACVHLMTNVLAALQYAHEHRNTDGSKSSVIHGDISPGNILIDVEGNVRLADFGIARIEVEQTSRQGPVDGMFRGKLPFAAPELLACENPTASSDIYACGVVLYQLLSGANPFSAPLPADVIGKVLRFVPPPLSSVRDDLPPGLDHAIARAFAKQPSQRYATAKEFASVLRQHLEHVEGDIAGETAVMIRGDFTGDLARLLGIESLEERELAWRKITDRPGLAGQLSMPPTVNLRLGSNTGPDATENVATAPAPAKSRPSPAAPVLPVAVSPSTAAAHGNRRLAVSVGAAGLVAAGVALAVVLGVRGATQPSEPHFLVVESRGSEGSEQPLAASPAALASVLPSATVSTELMDKKKSIITPKSARAESEGRDTLNAVTRAFARRQSAVQNCFQSNALSVSGSPEVSIRFSIDTQGQVTSAAVRPGAVATTALGSCLEHVARTTSFGIQEKPLVFSIPITAHAR
jgi:serine/threonine-protein kinase